MDAQAQASKCPPLFQTIWIADRPLTLLVTLDLIIAANKNIVYRTTMNDIGEKASQLVPERPVLHGCNMKFSGVSYTIRLT